MFAFVFDHNHDNPFPVRGYHGNRCFCGREEETKSILSSLDNGMNVTLFSARRLGKTGLIQHAFSKLPAKKWVTIYFDILATTSLQGFIETFAAAVWEAENQRSSIGKKLLSFVKTLRPTINFDPMTGEAQVSLGFVSENEKKNTLKALLRQLNGLDKRVAIAIDEFQQVANYKEQNMEALLRTEIQNLHNLAFIFSGSQRDMLAEMFGSAKRPFFSSARMFKLEKLPAAAYEKFIAKKFSDAQVSINGDDILFILEWTRTHTFYTQYVCNRLFSCRLKKISRETIYDIMYSILKENEMLYYNYRDLLGTIQWQLLCAIAKEQKVYAPTSKHFLVTYALGGTSAIRRALDALLKKQIIYREIEPDGKSYYEVYDVFFARWLEKFNY